MCQLVVSREYKLGNLFWKTYVEYSWLILMSFISKTVTTDGDITGHFYVIFVWVKIDNFAWDFNTTVALAVLST